MPTTQIAAGRRSRLVAATTGAALVAGVGGLVLAGAPAANAATLNLNKSYTYNCAVNAGPLPIGTHKVGVRAQVAVPSAVSRNQTVPARKTTITLTLPETLRTNTISLLQGKTAGGSSKDARVTVSAPGGGTQSVLIAGLSAPQLPIPTTANAPWVIPTSGTVPAIKVPSRAYSRVSLGMPAKFNVAAVVTRADSSTVDVTMACTNAGSGALGALAINKSASKVKAKASPKKIKAKKTKAKLKVSVATSNAPKASGKVVAKLGKKTVGKGTVRNGKATIKLKKFKKKGTYKVKVTYGGNAYSKGATKTVKVKVRK